MLDFHIAPEAAVGAAWCSGRTGCALHISFVVVSARAVMEGRPQQQNSADNLVTDVIRLEKLWYALKRNSTRKKLTPSCKQEDILLTHRWDGTDTAPNSLPSSCMGCCWHCWAEGQDATLEHRLPKTGFCHLVAVDVSQHNSKQHTYKCMLLSLHGAPPCSSGTPPSFCN